MAVAKILALASIILKAADVLTSYFLIDKVGTEIEANPLVRWTIESVGLSAAMGLSFITTSLLVLLAYKINRIQALWIITVILSIVCVNNVLHLILFFRNL